MSGSMGEVVTGRSSGSGADPAQRANAVWLLRLLAAAAVVVGHSCVIIGTLPPTLFGVGVHVLGVHAFFVISGYLITRSWQDDPSVWRFAWRRALRIVPALLALVVGTVLVLGPVLTTLPLGAYFAGRATQLYWWNAAFAPYYLLSGVFQDGRPYTGVNGSLWSLPIEAAMYAVVPVLGGRGVFARRVALPCVVVAAVAAAFVFNVLRPEQVQPVIWWNSVPFGLRFGGDSCLGRLCGLGRWSGGWTGGPRLRRLPLRQCFRGRGWAGLGGSWRFRMRCWRSGSGLRRAGSRRAPTCHMVCTCGVAHCSRRS